MRYAGRTHPGRRGGQNEDSMGWDEAHRLWFVADGMGGHASGDVASRIVRETLLASLETPLESAVRKAHEAVAAAAAANATHANMGSTVVAAHLMEGRGEIVWVGDSRAYLWRNNKLRQVSRDHSFLEMLRDHEELSEEEMRGHPNKNLVTQTLGLGTPQPSVENLPLRNGDWLLLCSDGLNDELEDKQIAQTLKENTSPEDAADALIAAALASGGKDNVSVIVVEYDGPDGVSFVQSLNPRIKQWLPIVAGVLAALIAAGLWLWLGGRN